MFFARSLRLRLLVLILVPLTLVATIAVSWQYRQSAQSAETVFDQKLSILALAIFKDLLATKGENLSPTTKLLFEEASGATFFYHVRGPDGGFINGYSPPPVRPQKTTAQLGAPVTEELVFFESSHRGKAVKVAQLQQQARIDQLNGRVVVSVWQDIEERTRFAQNLAFQGAVIALILILTASIVVFFGIRVGLRPLRNLEAAIINRSGTDLRPIMRQVPQEVRHIVDRLNDLFTKVTASQSQKDRFISNAAHQLRNPVAGIQSMAEVAHNAKTSADMKTRLASLLTASKDLSRLTQQLLSYERLQNQRLNLKRTSLNVVLRKIASLHAPHIMQDDIEIQLVESKPAAYVMIDETMIEQVFANLIDNALKYGGKRLSLISISWHRSGQNIVIDIRNDGALIDKKTRAQMFERFEQGQEGKGTGLGLAIVSEIMQLHNGQVRYSEPQGQCCFSLLLPEIAKR